MESDRGRWIRQLLERAGQIATLRQRKQSVAKRMAKVNEEIENARITTTLDDVASILGLPHDHPKVVVGTAFILSREDREERGYGEIDRNDVGYKADFSFD